MSAARLLSLLALTATAACAAASPKASTRERAASGELAELAYAEAGDGRPVVFVHGAYGDLRTFARAIPILSAGQRLIVPSLRYHWPNPWPASDEEAYRSYTVETHARDVVALIERLGVGAVDLVGHSYGGNVAAIVALSRPELVRRLVLIEPAVRWILREVPGGEQLLADAAAPREAFLARLRGGEDSLSVLRSVIGADRPGAFDAIPAYRRVLLLQNARTVGPYNAHPGDETRFTCDDARRIRSPLLLVQGEKTGRDFREIVARIAACVPEARTVLLPGSRHVVQIDAPEAMARAVVEFLAD